MRRLIPFLLVLGCVATALPAAAQDAPPTVVPFGEVHVGGGFTFALSDIRQYLGDGYHVNAGFTLPLTPVIGLQAEYSYNALGRKTVPVRGNVPSGAVLVAAEAMMSLHHGNLNLIVKPRTTRRAKPYVVAGAGLYYRPVRVTAPGVGYVPGFCSPWYYTCWPGGAVEVEQVLASGSTTDFGIDVGGGVYFLMDRDAGGGFYVEARYHYIWGPELKNSEGASQGKANGQFFPITVGLRF